MSNSNVFLLPTKKAKKELATICSETGLSDVVDGPYVRLMRNAELNRAIDRLLSHGEFCGAGEYFVDPKGVAWI